MEASIVNAKLAETESGCIQTEIRVLGGAVGEISELDPDWWKPMSDEEANAFYAGQ